MFVIKSQKSQLFLIEEMCSDGVTERWTIEESMAKKFETISEAATIVDTLRGSTFSKDCIIVSCAKEIGEIMIDFKVKITHSEAFWKEEIITATSFPKALDKVFKNLVKPDRVIKSIEICCHKRKTEAKVMRLEKSM